jgi:glyoxylase-like metal-dependent hydrolase (beta-lactamase superfamily II)
MKKITLLSLALCCALLFNALPLFAKSENDPKMFKIGKVSVWAVADSIGQASPGIFDVDASVYEKYFKPGKTPSAVMTFVIKTGKETVLVDTGYGSKASMLMDGLKKAGIKPEEITIVLITHMHGDHIGGLLYEDKIAFPNAKVKIGRIERDFWTSDKSVEKFPSRKANFETAKKVTGMYGPAVEVFEFGDEVVSGITAADASGHTPGHTSYMLESEGEKLQFIGDTVNAGFLQFPRPDISSKYDMDPVKAAQTREKILGSAAENKNTIAGAHIAFPGIGKVKKDGIKGYGFKSE